MPNIKSAKKRMRTNEIKHQKNLRIKSEIKTYLKKTEQLIAGGKFEEAKRTGLSAIGKLDKAASKKIIPRNRASRKITQLMRKLHKASGPGTPEPAGA